MVSLRARLALGAGWNLSIRLVDRGIGFFSTLILARLLTPGDFGVVAMGTAVQTILSVLGEFGFTKAVVRMRRPRRQAFDTAFTLNVASGLALSMALLAAIPVASSWYGDTRVTAVLATLSAMTAVSSFRNPGLARYERALDFRPFFAVALVRKSAAGIVGIFCAVTLADYRALLAGMLAGAVAEVLASYRVCRFRPRICVACWRELFSFSLWWLGSQAAIRIGRRGQDLFVGQQLGASGLGQFSIAAELATLPTTEVVAPVMKAAFPGYLQVRDDTHRLKRMFVEVWSAVALVALPSAAAIACLADMMIPLVLGSQWAGAAVLAVPLAALGVVQALNGCYGPILLSRAGPRSVFGLSALGAALTLPVFATLLSHFDLLAAIGGSIACGIIMLAVGARMVVHQLKGRAWPLITALVRPALGSCAMALALLWLRERLDLGNSWMAQLAELVALVSAGGIIYVLAVTISWFAAGRPDGAERALLGLLKTAFRQRTAA